MSIVSIVVTSLLNYLNQQSQGLFILILFHSFRETFEICRSFPVSDKSPWQL